MFCSYCGQIISARAMCCPHCGKNNLYVQSMHDLPADRLPPSIPQTIPGQNRRNKHREALYYLLCAVFVPALFITVRITDRGIGNRNMPAVSAPVNKLSYSEMLEESEKAFAQAIADRLADDSLIPELPQQRPELQWPMPEEGERLYIAEGECLANQAEHLYAGFILKEDGKTIYNLHFKIKDLKNTGRKNDSSGCITDIYYPGSYDISGGILKFEDTELKDIRIRADRISCVLDFYYFCPGDSSVFKIYNPVLLYAAPIDFICCVDNRSPDAADNSSSTAQSLFSWLGNTICVLYASDDAAAENSEEKPDGKHVSICMKCIEGNVSLKELSGNCSDFILKDTAGNEYPVCVLEPTPYNCVLRPETNSLCYTEFLFEFAVPSELSLSEMTLYVSAETEKKGTVIPLKIVPQKSPSDSFTGSRRRN